MATYRDLLHEARWIDAEGRTVSGETVQGYHVDDYFDLDLDAPAESVAVLRDAYKGADVDGIGLELPPETR